VGVQEGGKKDQETIMLEKSKCVQNVGDEEERENKSSASILDVWCMHFLLTA